MLLRAAEIGAAAGLRYVYAGNLPGKVGALEDTHCPQCREVLIERYGYLIRGYNLTPAGACPSCGTQIPGLLERCVYRTAHGFSDTASPRSGD